MKLKTEIAEKRFTIAVQPKRDDSIREFHHALDAIVLASKVDWDSIKRLNADIRERDSHERKKMREEARKEKAPKFHLFKEDENKNVRPPDKSPEWYIKDKENQRKIEVRKTDLEPLRKRSEEVIQRKPLEKIKKKDIENIKPEKIRTAMNEIWEVLDNMDENKRKDCISKKGNTVTISNAYFLSLDENHILHPKNTRAVLCQVKGTGVGQLWQRKDKKTEGFHYFKRVVPWDEVWFIKYKDNKGKGKKDYVRVTNKFYWKDKKAFLPSYERREVDKKLPDNYKVVCSCKGGEIVKLNGEEGEWKISKLGNSPTLKNLETEEEKTLSYKKLFEQMTYNTRKKIVS